MTQEALAQACGVTRQTIIALEAGRYTPSLELAFKLSRVFGVGVEDVFQYPVLPSVSIADMFKKDHVE